MSNGISKQQGIIFDMDNTLLQSRINFADMKEAVFRLLVRHQLCDPELDYRKHTASQLIELGRKSGRITDEIEALVWNAVVAFETEGMQGAVLEEHAEEVLDSLKHHFHLVILTNNALSAALEALKETGIAHYFDLIAGREQMTMLKPSPSGIHFILEQYPDIPAEQWTMVGDSWIDGKAAQEGSVRFIAYQGKPLEMERHEVVPTAYINNLRELLSESILP